MTALSADRDTKRKDADLFSGPVTAAVHIFAGSLVVVDASGNIKPAVTATGLVAAGRAEQNVDNTGGSAGAVTVQYRKGTFLFNNSASGDMIARANIGASCYIVDDNTVALTSGSGTRSVAGTVIDIDSVSGNPWVKIS